MRGNVEKRRTRKVCIVCRVMLVDEDSLAGSCWDLVLTDDLAPKPRIGSVAQILYLIGRGAQPCSW